MHDRENVGVEEIFIYPVGYPNIAKTDGLHERVGDFILPSLIEVVPEGFDDLCSHFKLVFLWIMFEQNTIIHLLSFGNGFN